MLYIYQSRSRFVLTHHHLIDAVSGIFFYYLLDGMTKKCWEFLTFTVDGLLFWIKHFLRLITFDPEKIETSGIFLRLTIYT